MLEAIYEWDQSLTEDEYYEAITYMIGDEYPDLTEEELEDTLEEMLEDLPEQYTDGVFDTLGGMGKTFANKSMNFIAKNPGLVKGAGTALGALGGPLGAKLGGSVAGMLTNAAQKRVMPHTLNTLQLMQNPEMQLAATRGALGIGNGLTPLSLHSMIPIVTFLRALNISTQRAIMEFEQQGVVPAESYFETLPYSEDVDAQAEWLAEHLTR